MIFKLDFVQFLASRSRRNALQTVYFFAKFIAEGAIDERKNEEFVSDSLGDAAIKLYKVELREHPVHRDRLPGHFEFVLMAMGREKLIGPIDKNAW